MEKYNYGTEVIKQGNSLCVRVPKLVVDSLKLKKGNEIIVSMKKMPKKIYPEEKHIKVLLTVANNVPTLNKFSQTKKRIFIQVQYELANRLRTIKNMKEKKKAKRIYDNLFKKLKKEFGEKFAKDYTFFSKNLAKGYNIDKEGRARLKPKIEKKVNKILNNSKI